MTVTAPSLLGLTSRTLEFTDDTVTALATVDPGYEAFPGHYPGFPVFPGVGLIEFADGTVTADQARRGRAVELVGVELCRFREPVFPGDELTIRVTYHASRPDDTGVRSTVAIDTGRGRAADLRIVHERRPAAGPGGAA
ncbi:3-hydroxyacyl-ACP dehydratase FabZ family protein [Streptomyces sp. NPDC087219]|uniref:3-hydroxyacyl-ACP dehydratase FabZ family protein n=1 Tax=Streptomyces sp. NPDC087219 TaxID=3365770 RepID=UPI00381B8862